VSFSRPLFLWLGLLALVELILALRRTPRIEAALAAMAGPVRRERLLSRHGAASVYGTVLSILFILSAAIALAGPAWGSRAVSAERSGLEVSLVIDVSRSMMAREGGVSRLSQARDAARSILRAAPGASFSLVAAKGDAILLVPMTDDLEAIDSGLDYADPDTMSALGTDLEAGIKEGLSSFTERSGANRVLILLSDGGEHGAEGLKAAAEAKGRRVRLIALGFGGEEARPVPGPTGSPLLDAKGKVVTSALDSSYLGKLAAASGGRFILASEPASRKLLLAELSGLGAGGKRIDYEVQDRSPLFALLAVIFLLGRALAGTVAGTVACGVGGDAASRIAPRGSGGPGRGGRRG
jgi:Ca-activated chloride channel family protein